MIPAAASRIGTGQYPAKVQATMMIVERCQVIPITIEAGLLKSDALEVYDCWIAPAKTSSS
jgi:hypothetical protein